ncbi:similar to Saccharomyces cerevisiae YFR045W Putative mitochondrial transport protein [Maudiozyma saulgeensis]|uniref:Similar to Saccharomyces cerevisiae YFR045W Putative mitochondrial transport protein n=1 Tax=Maudiozyma saulgeensis TaxID=1789683 RepID=A0A1X7RAX0_9SACH|nr:similar to Saccharomyces cerevisiae YFR045W Putative mitochondrial transport protein [Kazachstania saulgeensis]
MNKSDDVLTQVVAGSATAVFKTTLTQPFEYVKTVSQLRKTIPGIKQTVAIQPVKTYFVGCSILNIGAILKTGARFGTFEQVCQLMKGPNATPQTQLAGWQMAVAGIITGSVESLWIIPFENIKTRMIENSMILNDRNNQIESLKEKKPNLTTDKTVTNGPMKQGKTFHKTTQRFSSTEAMNPRYMAYMQYEKNPSVGMFNTIVETYRTRGLAGFVQGSMPTILRQIGNSMVRFTVYTSLKKKLVNPGEPLNETIAFILGATTSIAVVSLTQPLDVIKTRMQSKNAWKEYKNSLNCCYQIFINEGWVSLWKGSVPRLFKVGLSGGISFGIYQYVENLIMLMRKEGYLK